MKSILLMLLSFVLTTTINAQTKGKEFFVSPVGNDVNTGSITKPFRSIERARVAVQSELVKNKAENIMVYLRGGNYFVEKTIRFDERDGSKNGNVKYSGYKNEKATIYGGVPIKGWVKHSNNIYKAKLPKQLQRKKFYRLFDNSRSVVLARNPQEGSGFGGGLKRINNTTIQVPEEWKNYDFSNAQIYGWIGSNWFAELRAVQRFDKEKRQLTIDPGSKNFGGLNERIYIQGVPELLDEEKEWCTKNDSIYYYPSDKTDINKRLIIAPTTARVLEIKGTTPQQLVENITFDKLYFCGSDFTNSWRIFDANKDGTMPSYLQEGLIYIENAKNIAVKYCDITGAGHSAVYINNKSESCTVWGCRISYAGFCGIYANSFMPGEGGFANAQDSYINKKHNLSNNFIHHCGFSIGGGCGIQLFQSGENRIMHNVICDMPRYGISYKGIRNGVLVENPAFFGENINYTNHFDLVHTRNNYIAFNEIFNVCRTSFDFGAIESWGAGSGNVWDNNAVHDIDQSVEWDGWAHGLFTDDASDFVTLKNNIVFELKGGKATGSVMVKSVNEVVSNNIFADNAIGRVATMSPFAEPSKDNAVRKNIFFKSGEMLYDVDKNSFGENFYGFYENAYNKEYVRDKKVFEEVDFNLIYPNYVQLDTIKKHGWDVHSVVADPLFDKKHNQWDITYQDYKLKTGSPASQIGFATINYESIGLRSDFPFEKKLIRSAGSLIQAEDYNRMKDLRCMGSTGIHKMQPGAWAKYSDVDFGNNQFSQFKCIVKTSANNTTDGLFEIRLGSPSGELIGRIDKGETLTKIKNVKGIHNIFIVFQQDVLLDNFRFL